MPLPTVAAQNSVASNGSSSSQSISITPSGSNRYLLVAVQVYGVGTDTITATFNTSETMTKFASGNYYDSSGRKCFFELINPTATTANVVVTFPGAESEWAVGVVAYQDVDQTTPRGTAVTDFVEVATLRDTTTVVPSTSTTDLAVMLATYDGGKDAVAGTGLTSFEFDAGAGGGFSAVCIGHGVAGSPTSSMTIAFAGGNSAVVSSVGFGIRSVSGAAVTVNSNFLAFC